MGKLEFHVLVVIPLTLIHQLSHVTVSGETISTCFTGNQKPLQINCGSGYMLRIKNTFYGYSYSNNSCYFRPGDCTQTEHEAYPCTGRDTCSINLPSGTVGKRITNCDRDSNYFQVEYSCEPVFETKDICKTQLLTAQRGFISTPRYPNNYRENTDCLTQIQVHPSQFINLTVIDMDLDRNGTYGCNDWMYAFNQYRSVTLCGRRTNEKLTTLRTNSISMKFQSDGQVNKKGFWIYYEAYPPLPATQAPQTTRYPTPTTTKAPAAEVEQKINVPNSAASSSNTSTKSKEKLPFVAIVSGVIGTLTFILIVLLILLVYRWWHDKQTTSYKHKSPDVEYLDARNPAFRSSNGSEFGNIEIYYNC